MLTGENGILGKAKEAKVKTKKSEYEETLGLIGSDVTVQKELEDLTSKKVLDRYEDEIKKDSLFKGSIFDRVSDNDLQIETKEGYVYDITENDVEFLKQTETDESSGGTGVEMNLDTEEWAKKVVVTLVPPARNEGSTIYYSKDNGKSWYKYNKPFEVEENNTQILTKIGKGGEIETMNKITNIDKLPPEKVNIIEKDKTENSITISVEATDAKKNATNGESGILKYYYSKDAGATWEQTEGISDNVYTFLGLTAGKIYNVVVKVEDMAGNCKVSDVKVFDI